MLNINSTSYKVEQVILVDEQDNETGAMEKLEAHQKGLLHRAFSVLVFNSKGELLLQKRAKSKYHSGGLWTNTCCSHPHPGESIVLAGKRKLLQEMGFECELYLSHKFIYQVELDNNLIENECDYVMIGSFDGSPSINVQEAEDWKYESMESIRHDAAVNPDAYSYWFRLILNHPQLISKKPDPVY